MNKQVSSRKLRKMAGMAKPIPLVPDVGHIGKGRSHLLLKIFLTFFVPAILLVNAAVGQDSDVVNAFKHYLECPPQVREIKFAEVSNGQDAAPTYYLGASDGTNFFVRKYLPTENLDTPLSPTNLIQFPFFFGRAGTNLWEITGINIYQTGESTNTIALLVTNAQYVLDRGLSLGLINVQPGTVVWTNDNHFTAKRGGVIPSRTEMRSVRNGVERVWYTDPKTVSGMLYISNGLPSRIDCEYTTFYFDFRPSDGLPIGIPSTITTCQFRSPKSNSKTVMSVINYRPDGNLQVQDFEPYKYIATNYMGVYSRYGGGERALKDNAYAISRYEVESVHQRNSTRYLAVRMVLVALVAIPVLLGLMLYLKKRIKM